MKRLKAVATLFLSLSSFGGAIACAAERMPISREPSEQDWEFVSEVKAYQAEMPGSAETHLKDAGMDELLDGVAVAYIQAIPRPNSGELEPYSVELSQLLIPMSYGEFSERYPIDRWGTRLNDYLGGEVRVVERNAQGFPIRQIERMVLRAPMANQDMTKAERIEYEASRATVYWKVFHSDNDTTEADLGKLEVRAFGNNATLLTFHSAHRLKMGGVSVPGWIVRPMLKKTFLAHLRRYRES